MVSIKKPLFGKNVEIVINDMELSLAEDVAEKAYEEGLRLSKIFNFYDKKSELSLLNKKRKLKVSDEFIEVLKKSLEASEISGNYDVSLGKSIMKRKSGIEIQTSCSYRDIIIEGNKVILNHPDVEIDLGSAAKGYIVDKMVGSLKSSGVLSGWVDGRGDIRFFGNVEEKVGIQNPRVDGIIASIKVKNKAVATSGDYNQYSKSFDKSHILNSKEFASVTVVADDLFSADLVSTLIFVSQKEKIEEILEKYKDMKIMVLEKDLKIKYYNRFEDLLI